MTTSPRHPTPPPGVTVGGYELLSRLGEGGMGIVHLARRPGGPRVALKVLRPHVVGDDEARARLEREVSSLSRIRSRRVAEIVDADPWADIPYVATRYVPGLSLHDEVQELGPIEGEDLAWFAECLAEALAAVHDVGVLHRDIKPSNVLMEGRTPVLIDFGLARVAEDPRLTHTGWLLGTPGYLAPEILYGDDATTAADVHSWAATVAYAGLGRGPFGRGPAMAIMDRVRRGQHDLVGLDPEVREVVEAALDPEPARRPTLPELRSWLTGDGAPAPTTRLRVEDDVFTAPLALAAHGTLEAATERLGGWRADERDGYDDVYDDLYDPDAADDDPDDGDDGDGLRDDWFVAPPARPPLLERLRRLTLHLGVGTAVAAAVAVAPYLAVLGTIVLVWLLRSGSFAGSALGDRRRTRGPRWYDAPQAVIGAPFHLVASVPGTLVLGLWAGGIGLAAALLCFALVLSTTLSLGLVGGAFALGLWAGPGGGRVRRPVRRVVHATSRRPVPWLVTAAFVLAVASGFVALAQDGQPNWAPASVAPWDAVSLPSWL